MRFHLSMSLAIALAAARAGAAGSAEEGAHVNIYSHRHYEADQQLYELFEQDTGIRVNVVQASADELIERLRSEGAASPADVLITVDAGRLYRAKSLGLLRPIVSQTLNGVVPPNYRDPDGTWYGVTVRARVIAYHRARVSPGELSTYGALTEAEWKGRVLVRSSASIYNQSLLAAMIAADGPEPATRWAEGIVANMARSPKGNDRDQMKALAAGVGDVALVNTYYVGLMLASSDAEERRVGESIGVFFPDQDGRGTHVNVSGAGVTASSRNVPEATRFLEFMVSERAQRLFADANFEYPVRPDVPASAILAAWGSFRADPTPLALYGRHFEEAVRVFDRVGWR